MRAISFYLFLCFSLKAISQDGFIKGSPSLAYWSIGDKKEIVIALHGGPGAAHDYLRPEWDKISEIAQVVFYDQRGSGISGRANCYSWMEHVKDLKRVVSFFAKDKKVILAGSSWGSTLALLYVYIYPDDVKGIILSGVTTWVGKNQASKSCSAYSHTKITEKTKYYSFRYGFEIPEFAKNNEQKWDTIRQQKFLATNLFCRRVTLNSLAEAPTLKQLKKINVPVLGFEGTGPCEKRYGDEYLEDKSRQFLGVLPKYQIFTIAKGCHDPWYNSSNLFFNECLKFISAL